MKSGLWLGSLGLVGMLAGCTMNASYHEHRDPYYYQETAVAPPPPAPVYAQPAPVVVTPPPGPVYGGEIVIREAPPPPVREYVTATPGRGYVWINGYYEAHGGHWVWRPGHWERPPHANAHWVPPRYDRHAEGFSFSVGHWD